MAVHRIIEANAARYGDAPAISDHRVTLTYRELNQRANAVARRLIAEGFRRSGLAIVNLPRCADTAVVLLGVLKAGGRYVFVDPQSEDTDWPEGISFAGLSDTRETCYRNVDITSILGPCVRSSANLPIIARETDVACVIPDGNGTTEILVPHGTIMSLQGCAAPRTTEWFGKAGALDLWAGLLNGATVLLRDALHSAA
jgi:non-ribosomal peptide synthetase component F